MRLSRSRLLSQWLLLLITAVAMSSSAGLYAQQNENRQVQTTSSDSTSCALGPDGEQTLQQNQAVEQQMCLSEHIPGFGGYNFVGPCDAVAYLIDLEGADAARGLLTQHIEANSPNCENLVSVEIHKGDYEFADLLRLGSEASELLLRSERTRLPGFEGVNGPFFLDNRVTFYVDPEAYMDSHDEPKAAVAQAGEALHAHGFDMQAFHITRNLFSSSSLSYYWAGIVDRCIPVNPPLKLCFDVQDVLAGSAFGSSTSYFIGVDLQTRPDLTYMVMISWDVPDSLEEYADILMREEGAEWILSNPIAADIAGFPSIRFDLEPLPAADLPFNRRDFDPGYQDPNLMVLIDTGSGIATIIGTPRVPEATAEDLYSGAESVARILRIQQN